MPWSRVFSHRSRAQMMMMVESTNASFVFAMRVDDDNDDGARKSVRPQSARASSYLASFVYGLISSPPLPPMLSLLGASPYPPPPSPPDDELIPPPPRLLRLIANNFVVASFTFPSLASRTERTTIGSRSGNMSSSVRHAASKDGSLLLMTTTSDFDDERWCVCVCVFGLSLSFITLCKVVFFYIKRFTPLMRTTY